MIAPAESRPPRTARDGVDRATSRRWAGNRLEVSAGFGRTTRAVIQCHGSAEGSRVTVMTIDEKGPFVIVTVPGKHEIDSIRFEDRDRVLPHLNQLELR